MMVLILPIYLSVYTIFASRPFLTKPIAFLLPKKSKNSLPTIYLALCAYNTAIYISISISVLKAHKAPGYEAALLTGYETGMISYFCYRPDVILYYSGQCPPCPERSSQSCICGKNTSIRPCAEPRWLCTEVQ